MVANFKTYQIISKIFKNNLVFAITAAATAASTLLSSILYLCHELTLAEWNISPSLVDNPYSNNGIQMFVIIIVICILFLILQTLFTSNMQRMIDLIKTFILLNNCHVDIKQLKLTKLISISFLKTVTFSIIYILFLIFYPTLLSPHQNRTISTSNIQFTLIYGILIPTFCLMLFPSKICEKLKYKIKSSNKEQVTGKQISATFFSKTIRESHQSQSSASEKTIAIMSILLLILISVSLLILEPQSVRTKTAFWVTEIGEKTYIVPYASKETATVKEARISKNRICINLNSQTRTSIDGYILRYQEFDTIIWEEDSCERQSIYGLNLKLQQMIIDGLSYINNPR